MARTELHPESAILDGARRVIVESGPRAATIASIAAASGAPSGSIYHRFHSVEELLARLWLRAVGRFQQAVLSAPASDDPREQAVNCALGAYDFCLSEPEDARLLSAFGRADFALDMLPARLRQELTQVNDPIRDPMRELARRLYGRASREAVDALLLAVVDLPYGAARPYAQAGSTPSSQRRERLAGAVRSALADAPPDPPVATQAQRRQPDKQRR
jgi:AcrR family transcriptional regulator